MNHRISFIVHGRLAKKDVLESKLYDVFSSDFDIDLRYTETGNSAADCVQQAIEKNVFAIIAVGGDGTLSEVIDAVIKFGVNSNVLIGLLPKGSGNDFARTLGVSFDPNSLKTGLLNEKYIEADVLKITNSDSESRNIRYCINIADVGIGGEVAKYLHGKKKLFGASFTYVWATLRAFFVYKKQKMRIKSDQFTWQGDALGICMANGKYFGSGLGIAPKAKIDDGKMQIVVLGGISLWDYLLQIWKVKKCIPLKHKHVHYYEAESVQILATKETYLDVDGEYNGSATLTCDVHKKAIRLVIQ